MGWGIDRGLEARRWVGLCGDFMVGVEEVE